jgi:hypothetical protein
MNQRERLLAIVVGAVGFFIVAWFAWSYVDGQYRTRRTKISSLEGDIKRFKMQAMQGAQATAKLADYEAQSLPPDPETARSLYQDWLLSIVRDAGLTEQQVEAKTAQKEGDLYISQAYVVSGKATLPQIVDLLHAFYSVDYLHRMRLVMLKPIKESKLIDVTLNIDAVSVSSAPPATSLHGRPSTRLALPKKEDYLASILGRNLFGPPNRAPSLTVAGSDVRINRSAEVTARATDPDPLDKVKFRLVESAVPEARLDPVTGRLSLTPKSLGKLKFTIEAYDDGYPSKTARREVVLNVVDPPPPPDPQPRPPVGFTGFDQAKFTVLAAVIDVSGEGEVWLHNRPAGKMLKLRVGDNFEIGSIKGTIEEIGEKDFTFSSAGKLRKLGQGEMLEQASSQPQDGPAE